MDILRKKIKNAHILIIGSGIIGKFNAVELSKLGCRITIVDPNTRNNGSNASLGVLMGKIYQKREGRSWNLRKKSLELWPKWIKTLQEYNPSLTIEKPFIKLTTNNIQFQKMKDFVKIYSSDNLEIIEENSSEIKEINKIFFNKKLKGIISHEDGRINPQILLNTLDIILRELNVSQIPLEIKYIEKKKDKWIAISNNKDEISSDAIILCNSINADKLLSGYKSKIKLKPVVGQAIELDCHNLVNNFLCLPKIFNINGINIIPSGSKKIILGSTTEFSEKAEKKYLEKLYNFLEIKPNWLTKENTLRTWFGIRSRPESEGSPILKSLDNGLIICTGFYKNGILLAPACAEWTFREIQKYF
tara:strand:- start:1916 stop:2995 length:1080 start_codon:yes stop_codon:yes gene_type:complete